MSIEPWLRGPLEGVNPLVAPILRALEQAQEDLNHHCAAMTDAEIWARPLGMTPLGFHLRHIAGSLDRLTIYLEGGQLGDAQFVFLRSEMDGGGTLQELLALIGTSIARASHAVRVLDPEVLASPRAVGRKHLPTTVIGLAIHLAEHTQRHVGQVIIYCNLLKVITGSTG